METSIWFRSICQKNRYDISDAQLELLQKYVSHLLEWNKRINLISRRDEEHVWTRHVLGSIALLFQFEFLPRARLIDIGTGGGLPGIPLGILSDNLDITLVDSIQKKIRAVTEIISSQKFGRIKTVCGRIEELNNARPLHQAFDYVIARGVGSISDIMKWSFPLLKPPAASPSGQALPPGRQLDRGSVILLKGGDLTGELEQARLRHRPREIGSYPVIIDGIDPSELFEKKIVIIRP